MNDQSITQRPVRTHKYIARLLNVRNHGLVSDGAVNIQRRLGPDGAVMGISITGRQRIRFKDGTSITINAEVARATRKGEFLEVELFSYHYEGTSSFRADKPTRQSEPHINDTHGNHLRTGQGTSLDLTYLNLWVFYALCLAYMRSGRYPAAPENYREYHTLMRKAWEKLQ